MPIIGKKTLIVDGYQRNEKRNHPDIERVDRRTESKYLADKNAVLWDKKSFKWNQVNIHEGKK